MQNNTKIGVRFATIFVGLNCNTFTRQCRQNVAHNIIHTRATLSQTLGNRKFTIFAPKPPNAPEAQTHTHPLRILCSASKRESVVYTQKHGTGRTTVPPPNTEHQEQYNCVLLLLKRTKGSICCILYAVSLF